MSFESRNQCSPSSNHHFPPSITSLRRKKCDQKATSMRVSSKMQNVPLFVFHPHSPTNQKTAENDDKGDPLEINADNGAISHSISSHKNK